MKSGTLFTLVTAALAVLVTASALVARHYAKPGPLAEDKTITIPAGTSVTGIASLLEKEGIIQNPTAFKLAAQLTGLAPTLKAGEYTFPAHISLRSTLNKLALGRTAMRSLTLPEGYTTRQIMALMASEESGLKGNAPIPEEGSVFPDTYKYTAGTGRHNLLKSMQSRMNDELMAAWQGRDTTIPLRTPAELLNLASIVQKEAANEEEMPMIAAVFQNRLKKGMKLQADPTVIYGMESPSGTDVINIRRSDLSEPHPFNTYVYIGLPPTPISNPGRAALLATANPAQTDALFFMANPSRTGHTFATTYADHKKNVQTYWQNQPK
ncbi:MAG: endolytic transglycosylase MltG [Alphaproteobacteria bacterium CG_4_10_14_0_8_um_filter_53_9]|nr:MAG: endolytic transglycosylase MltG [Alphaproteobacteria bacterium CG_4_10_14_0_8_um_filter_53_9]